MKKTFLLICLFAITCLTSCKTIYDSSPTYTLMSSDEVRNFIVETNKIRAVGCSTVPDSLYAVPTVDWIKTSYTKQLKKFLFDNQLSIPSEVENDCDKFAGYGLTVGHLMHHHAVNKPKHSALTIGEFDYFDTVEGHAINFFIATDNKKLVLVFFEPQTQQIIQVDIPEAFILNWRM